MQTREDGSGAIRIGLYGVSGAGKTTLASAFADRERGVWQGSESGGISKYFAGDFGKFLELPEIDRQNARENALSKYFALAGEQSNKVIIDAHYSFWIEGDIKCVAPDAALRFYTHFLYYDPGAKEIQERRKRSYRDLQLTEHQIHRWSGFEKQGLRAVARAANKVFREIGAVALEDSVAAMQCILRREMNGSS